MPSSDKIDLKASLEDSPQVQAMVSMLENNIVPMKDCTVLLRDTFEACSKHQQKVCEGTDALTKLLQSFQEDTFSKDDSFLSGSFSRLGRYLTELHSCQDMLSTQLESAVIELLSQFISNDFAEVDKLKESYDAAWQEHEQATVKFSRVSKKKDSDKNRFEANSDLFTARKKYYESCLDYYSRLNGFKLKWKYSLMEPLLTYMHAQMAYFKAGHEVLNKELGKVLNELNSDVQKFHNQYQQDMAAMAEEKEEIKLSFPTLCLPDPDPKDPFIVYQPPRTTVSSKSGYLFLRVQKSGFSSQWDRGYFYTKKGSLHSHFPQKTPESLSLKSATVSVGDIDDRRYVFQITHSASKRPTYLMAENDVDRDEWIAAISNSGKERSSNQPNVAAGKDVENIMRERDRIRVWVKKEIDVPPPKPPPSKRDRERSSNKVPRSNTVSAPNLPLPKPSKSPSPTLQPRQPKGKRSSDQPSPFSPTASSHAMLPTPLQPVKVPAASVPAPQSTAMSSPKKFFVKYLGHTEIKDGKAPNVITDTIRKVMAARSLQNVKSSLDIEMTIGQKSIVFMDLSARKAIGQIQLKGVIRSSTHPDNIKLLGVVNRSLSESDKSRYICHVLESDLEGSKICKVIDDSVEAALLPSRTKASSQHKDYTDFSNSDFMHPRRPPPPIFKPISSSGYVTLDKEQVIAANASKSMTTPSTDRSTTASSNPTPFREPPPPPQPRPLPPPSSTPSNPLDFISVDSFSEQGSGNPQHTEHKFSDSFVSEESADDSFQDLDDLPPLDSPPPETNTRVTNSSYISDSSFTATPSSSVEPSIAGDEGSSMSGYFSQGIKNAASASDSFENSSVWSGVSGQQSSVADSGYYKVDGGISTTSEQQNTTEDFDLFQDTFNDFSSTPGPADSFSTNQQSFVPTSNATNFGYFTSQSSTTSTGSAGGTVQKPQPSTSYTTPTYNSSTYSSAPLSSNLQSSNNLGEEEFDLGEPVDLLSDLSEPFDNGSNFQSNFTTGQSSSSGYYHADQTTSGVASTSGTGYFSSNSSTMGGFSTPLESTSGGANLDDGFDDDWLPSLPDEEN